MHKPPIFIGGAGRSGTTLMRVILDTHPNIVCGPEFKIIPVIADHWAKTIKNFGDILRTYNLGDTDVNSAYRTFIQKLLSPFLEKSGKKRLAEKSPNNVFYFYHLNQLFPKSPLVHMIRDGRDVVCSLLAMDWVSPVSGRKLPYVENAENAARYWVQAVRTGRNAAQVESIKKNYYEIRYEDIVHNPEDILKELFGFLNEPWDPAVLDFHLKERDLGSESSASQVSQKIYTHAAGRWKKDLCGKDRDIVKKIAGDLLIELGYAENYDW